MPEDVQERLRTAGPDAPSVALALTRDLLAQARDLAAGIYVVAPFRRPLGVLELFS